MSKIVFIKKIKRTEQVDPKKIFDIIDVPIDKLLDDKDNKKEKNTWHTQTHH